VITGIISTNTKTFNDVSKEFGIEINTEKTKYTYMVLFNHQNAEQNHDMNIANSFFF
jgi:hypothetical protein